MLRHMKPLGLRCQQDLCIQVELWFVGNVQIKSWGYTSRIIVYDVYIFLTYELANIHKNTSATSPTIQRRSMEKASTTLLQSSPHLLNLIHVSRGMTCLFRGRPCDGSSATRSPRKHAPKGSSFCRYGDGRGGQEPSREPKQIKGLGTLTAPDDLDKILLKKYVNFLQPAL